jgi:uncharacterized membrane protein YkgB
MNEDPNNKQPERSRNAYFYGSLYPGVVIVVVGILFILGNFGILKNGVIWGKLWPVFIIIAGLFMIFRPRRK